MILVLVWVMNFFFLIVIGLGFVLRCCGGLLILVFVR